MALRVHILTLGSLFESDLTSTSRPATSVYGARHPAFHQATKRDGAGKVIGSVGEYNWGGAASTAFWIDPSEDLTVIFLTQLLPSSTHPIRSELKQLVYQAITE